MSFPRAVVAGLLVFVAVLATGPTAPALGGTETAASPRTREGWAWPLPPRPAVARRFDPPAKPWLSGHRGVDLLASGEGATVMSPEAGSVSFVGTVVNRPVIAIDHGNGLRSSFEPVVSKLAEGTPVAKGEAIGILEPGHCSEAPCLHWGVRRGEEYLNPLAFVMDLRPSVLLPLE